MTFIRCGTGNADRRCIGMNKPDTSRTMRRLADKMRKQALETALPAYQSMMDRAADSLDAEAALIADQQFMEFALALDAFSDSQFTTRYH
jgi:hypothetical protein